MDEIASQPEVVAMLRKALASSNLPNLLFYGPPGTGKTSTVLALARELYGPQLYRQRVLELNASDERGIGVVREKIKGFAQLTANESALEPVNVADKRYPCPKYKLIVLDEADSLTADAQTALRRIMEVYSKTTRFCLIGNYISRIIDPLTSRCAKFRFRPVDMADGLSKLREIVGRERVGLVVGNEIQTLQRLLEGTEGDLRRAITGLQSAHRLTTATGQLIDIPLIDQILGKLPEELVDETFEIVVHQKSYSTLATHVDRNLVQAGYPAAQLLAQLQKRLTHDPFLKNSQKAVIALAIADLDYALVEGADEHLQLLRLLSRIQQISRSFDSIVV